MAAMLTIARVDGTVFILDPRKLLVPGMVIPEGATLFAPDGGRIILADATVLPLAPGAASLIEVVDGVATLGGDAAPGDPDIAALQQAIAAGVDPTAIQEAPAAGQAEGGGGGSLSGSGGFSSPFDISRVGREETSAYRYQAGSGGPANASVTPASFSPQGDDAEATPPDPVPPADGGDGGTTAPPTDGDDGDTTTPPTGGDGGDTTTPPTGGGTTTPPTDGGTTAPPTDGGDEGGTTNPPTDGGDGDTTTPPIDGGDEGDTTNPPTDGDDGDTTAPPTGGGDGDTTTPPTGGDDGDTTTPPTDGGDDGDTTTPLTGGGGGDTTTPPTDGG
ncbi:retention module-containing protein, partial [Salinicola halophilus]|uniref:retention module-containing protein n=1 Tax=Salinicola halophilus TaxID=184065 RepID=UPI0013A63D14